MQVCFACQHSFPASALDTVQVSDELAGRLETLRMLVSRVQPATSAGRQAVADMEDELRTLLSVIRKELDDKQAKIRKLELQLNYVNKENENLRRNQLQAAVAQAAPQKPKGSARNSAFAPSGPTNMLERFLSSNTLISPRTQALSGGGPAPPMGQRGGSSAMHNTNRSGGGNNGSSALNAAKPSDLVSSAIYCSMEALVVMTRAEVGVLWLRPQDSAGELLAPFIAGHSTSSLRASAPYRISASSLVGTVASTGIAVNLSPRCVASKYSIGGSTDAAHHGGGAATSAEGDDTKRKQSFAQFLQDNDNANLLVPVYARYGEHARTTVGVVQLIGSTAKPFPFSERNELNAAQAALLLSHTITSFMPSMLVEWSTRIYDHTNITSSASYSAALDQRAAEKGIDDFDPTPMLIFRSDNSERSTPTNLAQTKVLKHDMMQAAVPLVASPGDKLKELNRYLRSLEDNWGQSVTLQTVLEKKVDQLSSQLEAARHGLHTMSREKVGVTDVVAALKAKAHAVAQPRGGRSAATAGGHRGSTGAASTVDVEEIENDVMQRLKTSTTAVFLTASGDLSTPAKRQLGR